MSKYAFNHAYDQFLQLPFGANISEQGVKYRVWAPLQEGLQVEVLSLEGLTRLLPMTTDAEGYQCVCDHLGGAGDRYRIHLPDGSCVADPVSRAQESCVQGYSLVVDPTNFVWQDQEWQRPPFRDLVIYELHIGTFSPEGTYLSAIPKLSSLKEIGINAIELMPIADFPGKRNWGYDGVHIYAPAHAYGTPDELRHLVNAAHSIGIAVILDVVYNHAGPDGSSLMALSADYFNVNQPTPWGRAFNFDGPNCTAVREYFAWNPVYWMTEFHIDGVRLDATHAIFDHSEKHILSEIAERIHSLGGYVIAEDERNEAKLIIPRTLNGYGLDAVWADDFHHSIRVGRTGQRHAYLQKFSGDLEETLGTLHYGWHFPEKLILPGENESGVDLDSMPPAKLIHCIMNHDQVGNQPFGIRLNSYISEASYRAISMLLCLTPYTPLIFMGQEWGATTPFQYFTDHHAELGRLVTEGRRREFAGFPEFSDETQRDLIPDPQAESTFDRSKLNWEEAFQSHHRQIRNLYASCLTLRHQLPALRPPDRSSWKVSKLPNGVGYIHFEDSTASYALVFHLWPTEPQQLHLSQLPLEAGGIELLLSSNDTQFGGNGPDASHENLYILRDEETLLFRRFN